MKELKKPLAKIEIKPAVRELLCQRCEQEYPVWFAPNEVWNKVQRDGEHFLCLNCFTILAEQRGLIPTAWCLDIERFDEDRWKSAEDFKPLYFQK